MTLMTRLRASLGFDGFKAGGPVHADQVYVQALKTLVAQISATLPPQKLLNAEAKAHLDLDKARRAIRTWELANQVKLAKAENDIAAMPKPAPVRGWNTGKLRLQPLRHVIFHFYNPSDM